MRVFSNSPIFQLVDDASQVGVEPFNFYCVVKQVTAHGAVVGQVGRDFDVLEVFPFLQPGAVFIKAVRFVGAVPKAERLSGFSVLEKLPEVGGIVDTRDAAMRGFEFDLLVFLAGGIVLIAGHFVVPRPPAFASQSHMITRFLQQGGVNFELLGENRKMAHGFFQLPGVAAG